jgi:2-phospho-L-lactate guanylyltransferase
MLLRNLDRPTKVGAVVVAKALDQAKSRLAGLNEGDRRGLAKAMLLDVLEALASAPLIPSRVLVSPDTGLRAAAVERGFQVLADEAQGMSRAFGVGLRWCEGQGCGAAVALPADLPLVTARDLGAAAGALGAGPRVIIVPSWNGGGTSLLALAPPRVIPLHFEEPQSHLLHAEEARRRGIPHRILHLPGPALDIDSLEDLRELLRRGGEGHTLRYLRASGLDQRLDLRVVP